MIHSLQKKNVANLVTEGAAVKSIAAAERVRAARAAAMSKAPPKPKSKAETEAGDTNQDKIDTQTLNGLSDVNQSEC